MLLQWLWSRNVRGNVELQTDIDQHSFHCVELLLLLLIRLLVVLLLLLLDELELIDLCWYVGRNLVEPIAHDGERVGE